MSHLVVCRKCAMHLQPAERLARSAIKRKKCCQHLLLPLRKHKATMPSCRISRRYVANSMTLCMARARMIVSQAARLAAVDQQDKVRATILSLASAHEPML